MKNWNIIGPTLAQPTLLFGMDWHHLSRTQIAWPIKHKQANGEPLIRDENNGFLHREPLKAHFDITIYIQDVILVFWNVVGSTVKNKMLKIYDNIITI